MSFPSLLARVRTQIGSSAMGMMSHGLSDGTLSRFANDPFLSDAMEIALEKFEEMPADYRHMISTRTEQQLINDLQKGYVNFYDPNTINPYIPLGSAGPWVISTHGGVFYDTGGYGMLGLGQNPTELAAPMAEHTHQANIMTASFSQKTFYHTMMRELNAGMNGCAKAEQFNEHGSCGSPYDQFMCLNSGSESVGLAIRVADAHAKQVRSNASV
jgi:4-aminobutyrate aminotransferase-like enzyme